MEMIKSEFLEANYITVKCSKRFDFYSIENQQLNVMILI